jgi:hypothetical protein
MTVVMVAPMAKKDAVSKRLAKQIAFAKHIKEEPRSPGLWDLATPDEKEELAASLWMNEKDPFVGPVRDAFKAFGLDHQNIGDWRNLAAHLAHVLFARSHPGRQRKWTDERLCQLLADVAAYKRKHPNKAADTDICRWLQKKKSYRQETSGALRRALQDARNPKRNSDLARKADFLTRQATGNWTGPHDEATTVKVVNLLIERADEFWGLGE